MQKFLTISYSTNFIMLHSPGGWKNQFLWGQRHLKESLIEMDMKNGGAASTSRSAYSITLNSQVVLHCCAAKFEIRWSIEGGSDRSFIDVVQ